MVDTTSLENWHTRKGIGSSNLPSSEFSFINHQNDS